MTDSRRIFSYIPGLSRLTGRTAARKPSQLQLNLQNLEARVTPAAALTSDLLQPGLAALQLGNQLDSASPTVDMTAQAGVSSTDARLLSAAFMAIPVNQPAAPSISLLVTTPSKTGSLVATPSYSTSSISVSPFKLQLSSSDRLAGMVQQGASQAFASLRAFSQSPAFASTLKDVFGGNANAALLRYGLTQNGINIRVQLVSGSELPGARAAYTPAGADGVETIYLNRDWLAKSRSVSEVQDLLIEELGHALDVRVNGASDSAGDEGDLFMRRVTGKAISADTLAALKVEDDHATVTIAGKRVAIEMATAPFQGAYKLLESVEESATATTTTAIVGTNFAFTSADPTQVQFSGNNVPGTFSYTDSNNQVVTINGEVSRLIKDKGLQAVYFHTIGFDNAGSWMLVVNPSYFQNNTQYKTSSDPVDQALNGLISAAPTQITVITSVTDDVSPQTGLVNNGGYTNDTSPLISGTISAALGTSEVVAVFRDGTYIGVATVSGTTWTFADSGLANGTNYTYTAAVVNSSTQASAPLSNSYVVKVDTQAPALTFSPITGDDNITQAEKDAGVTLTGTAEPGATVAISYVDASGNTVTRNATVDANGNWSYALTANDWTNIGNASSVQFTATATDLAGNTSSTSRTALLAPPAMAVPGVPDLVTADDTGSSNTDNITSKTTVQLTVAVPNSGANPALPGQWLEIVDANGQVLGSHVLTEDDIRTGSYTFIVPNLQQGTYTVSSRLVDTVTNTTSVSQGSLLLTIDTTAPLFGVTSIGEDTGASPTDKITNDRELTITGTGEPGSTINVYDNGVLVGTAVVGPDGKYSVTTSPLADGSHPLTITATDPAGNVNGPTSLGTWVIDTQAPTLTNLSVSEDTGLSPTDKITSDRVLTVTGTTEPNSFVQVYDSTSGTPVLVGQGTADANGNFSIDTSVLADGAHPLTITSTDPAGNVSQPVSLGTWVIDSSKPAAPTNLSVSEDTGLSPTDKITSDRVLTVTSTAEPNSLVKIYDSSSGTPVLVGQGFADASGNFSIDTSVLADGAHPLTITATDAAGNESQPASLGTWVIDTTKPAAPTNLSVSEDTGVSPTDKITSDRVLTVTGTAEPNSLVKVYDSSSGTPVLVGQGYADANGNFSIDTSVLADGSHPLSITATDAAGNESLPASLGTWVIDTQTPAFTITSVGLDTGSSPTDKLTSDNVLTVTGTGEPGAIVKIFDNGQLVGTGTIQPNGTFSIDTSVLSDGSHPLTATATDVAGNVNGPVSLGTWVIDTLAPVFNITSVGLDTGSSPTDKITNDNVLTVTGTGEPGAIVKIYDNGQLVGTGIVQPDGTFSIDTSVLADGSHPLTATATDAAGNVSAPKDLGTWVIDTLAPAFNVTSVDQDTGRNPTDKVTSDNVLTVTGTGEPGATVKIYDNGQLVGTGLIGPDGKFSIDTSVLADGSHPLTAIATDTAGNSTAPVNLGTWVIDTKAPNSPQALSVSEDTGLSPTDKLTNDRELTVTGIAEPNSLVKVYDTSSGVPVLVGQGYADANGNFSVTTSPLADGAHPLSITATDLAGNESGPVSLGTWTIDATKPLAPTALSVSEDTGSSPTDKVTSDRELTVTGKAEPNSLVKVYDTSSGTPVLVGEGFADGNGNFSITTIPLADGSHPLSITATDAAGNESGPTSLGIWVIDTTAPQAPAVVNIGEDTADPSDKVTSDNTLTITGTGEPGSTITVYADGVPVGTATVGPDGKYSVTASPLADGTYPISITATDPAGNESAPTDLGVWVIDTQAPAAPQVASVSIDTNKPDDKVTSDNVLTVTGTAEPNSLVKVYDNSSGTPVLVGEGYADANGNYSIDTDVLADGEHPLSVTATDKAGNESAPTDLGIWIIDTIAPSQPAITGFGEDTGNQGDGFTQDNDLFLTGTAEPNSMVEVFDNGVSLGVVQADENGNWRLPTTGLLAEGPHSFTIQATDLAGNVSAPSNPLALNVTKPLASASPTGEQSMDFTIDRDQTDNVLTVGGTGPWTYAVADGQLPDGLSIDPNTGAISGTAERLQDVVVEVLVTDANGETVRIPIRIVIEAAAKPLLVSSGVGTNTNLGNIPSSMVNGYTYGDGTAVTLYDTADFLPSGQTVPFIGYTGEVRVSLDDLDGNGRPDIVAAAGVGAQPHIRVLDIETGASKMSFLAFDQGYRGGMFVSTGDINGDNHADIAVVSGIGSRSHVKVFDGKTGAEIASFYAFEEGFTGGATLAVGDTDGDGVAEIIVGKGPGDLPLVRVFEHGANGWQMRSEFLAFEKFFRGGVFVAIGDIGGDNRIEIAVGANAGASASVALFDAETKDFIDQFYAYGQLDNVGPFKGGARVAIEDYNRDGVAELITGAGPGSYPHLRVWEVDDTIREIASLLVAESGYTGGVHLG